MTAASEEGLLLLAQKTFYLLPKQLCAHYEIMSPYSLC